MRSKMYVQPIRIVLDFNSEFIYSIIRDDIKWDPLYAYA